MTADGQGSGGPASSAPADPGPRISWRGLRWGRWRRGTKIYFGIAVLVFAVPVAYLRFWPHDSSTAVDAGDVLDEFRQNTSPTTEPSLTTTSVSAPDSTAAPVQVPPRPAEGVYRYATTGDESVDILTGSSHTYPAETTLTVRHTECGAMLTWTALKERSDTWGICTTPEGIVWQGDGVAVWHHEFFGQDERTPTYCPDDVLMLPASYVDDPMAGMWEPTLMTCICDDRDWPATWELLGVDERVIDGVTVQATHVRLTITWRAGEFYEDSVIDYWLDRSGLPVAMSSTKVTRTDSGVIGAVTYREQFTAELLSLTPLT
ncbi:MAG: hypothetical protein ACO3S5_13185 [Ilumatobacteraceae bacterium]